MSILSLRDAASAGAPPASRDQTRLFVATTIVLFLLAQTSWRSVAGLNLPDNDDAMRLVQVRDLLAGQGWFDIAQHRYLPPGAPMHWSRWIDAPIAALILLVRPVVGQRLAEIAALMLWPALVFAGFATLLWHETRRLFGTRAAGLTAIAATQLATIGLWAIGRIDHHNVQVLLVAAAALHLADPGPTGRRPALAGLFCALSMGIGLETLPFVAIVAGFAVIAWIVRPQEDARPLAWFGVALAAGSALVFVSQVPPARWLAAECDALSPPWLLLSIGGGLGGAVLAASGRRLAGLPARLAAAAGLGAALVAAFALAFPACLAGPFASLPALARTHWLDTVAEAQPAAVYARNAPGAFLSALMPVLAGIAVCLTGLRRETGARRRALALAAATLAAGLLVMLVQLRGIYIGNALMPLAAGYAALRALEAMERREAIGRRIGTALLALATVSSLWIFGAIAAEGAFRISLAAPKFVREQGTCARIASLEALNAAPPGLVLASTELGSNLLVATHHAIIAAPYHRNGEGIAAGLTLELGDEAAVRREVARFHPDYVLVCDDWSRPAAVPNGLSRRLAEGERIAWLAPVPLEGAGGLRLFQVRPQASPPQP